MVPDALESFSVKFQFIIFVDVYDSVLSRRDETPATAIGAFKCSQKKNVGSWLDRS